MRNTFKSFIVSHPKEEIEIGYLRGKDKNIQITKVTPILNPNNGEPMIGIAMDQIGISKLPLLSALKEGMSLTDYLKNFDLAILLNGDVAGIPPGDKQERAGWLLDEKLVSGRL